MTALLSLALLFSAAIVYRAVYGDHSADYLDAAASWFTAADSFDEAGNVHLAIVSEQRGIAMVLLACGVDAP